MKKNLFPTTVFAAAMFASSLSFGQVKIGSNPTTISANTNLEVQATNGHRTVVKQDNGFVGVGTITPNTNLQVESGNFSVSQGADNTFNTGVVGAASIGRANINWGNYSLTVGQDHNISAVRSLLVGLNNTANINGDNSIALGTNSQANAINSFAGGNASVTTGSTSMAFGFTSRASGPYSVALGNQSQASGSGAIALGTLNVASGDHAIAGGYSSVAVELGSIALGRDVRAGGTGGVSLGWLTQANGPASVALGYQSFAAQNTSVAIGNNARSNHDCAFVFSDNSSGGDPIGSWANNTMTMRFGGGYRFYTNGTHTAGVQLTPGDVTWGAISDIRSKEDISDIQSGLATIMQLRPKKYHYKKTDKKHFSLGFIAQEMVKVLPDIVNVPEDKEDLLSIRYTELVPVLTKAIQEQQAEITDLRSKLAKMSTLEAKLADLEAKFEKSSTGSSTAVTASVSK